MSPPAFDPDQRALLLELARESIHETLERSRLPKVDADHLPPGLDTPRACFVTLTNDDTLRGCIGNLEPRHPLYRAVMLNARSAATRDTRFPPVTPDEVAALTIEISVLSPPEPLKAADPANRLAALHPHQDGVILRAGRHSATYLPQVWEKLGNPRRFLESLSRKAGLPAGAWADPATELRVYRVESFTQTPPT